MRAAFRYEFDEDVSMQRVEASLWSSILAIEGLHGEAAAHHLVDYGIDSQNRRCIVDAGSQTGEDLNRIFVGHLRRELGPKRFAVTRIDRANAAFTHNASTN